MSKANAEHRNLACEVLDGVDADTGLMRSTGAGGDEDAIRMKGIDLDNRRLIVASDFYVRPQFAKILDQVVGEGIVIV